MQISKTSSKILSVLFNESNKDFYINELVRKTGSLPNSVFRSLKTLYKQKILTSYRSGKKRFFRLNNRFQNLNEIRSIVRIEPATSTKINWVKILNRETHYSFNIALCVANVNKLKSMYGVSVSTYWYNGITFGVYYQKEALLTLGKVISEKMESDKNFAEGDIDLCYKVCNRLVQTAKQISKINLVKKSNKMLAQIFRNYYKSYLDVFPFVTTPHAIERYFEGKIKEAVKNKKSLEILLSPVSTTDEERDSALKIASYVRMNGFDKKSERLINKHRERFCWLPLWSIYAKPLNHTHFENEIKNILERVKNPLRELKRLKLEEKKAKKILTDTLKRIKASSTLMREVKLLQEYIYLRTFRKNCICQAHYYHLPLLYESAKRLDLSLDEIKILSYEEIIDGLNHKISQNSLKRFAKNRQAGWATLMKEGKIRTVCGVREIIETMERYQIIAPTSSMQRTVKGRIASRGKVIGKVKIVKKLSELNKVEKGDILVAKMTTPDYMIAINKAAAIVTDEGGVTCHAAIVAREFNIPCITATKNATQILSDNDLVEVDAFKGIVTVVEAIETPENIKVMSGRTIYNGKVRGIARIVLDASDFEKVKRDDILIAPQTTPEYLSSLYRVKGFIVDEESLTSHASLYGKALKLPSIMGTKYARNVIKDGEKIELDATRGIVRRLNAN